MILEIAFPIPVYRTFDYKAPAKLDGQDPWSLVGRRVKAPFGPRSMAGLITAVKDQSQADPENLKSIIDFLDEEPLLQPMSMDFAQWLAQRTLCSYGEALFALLPPAGSSRKSLSLAEHPNEPAGTAKTKGPLLTPAQRHAVEQIFEALYSRSAHAFLLYGVAVAGKTEVYLSAIKEALDHNRSALYVVPEKSLMAQVEADLKKRFGKEKVALWHSDVTPAERRRHWQKIKQGEIRLVLGTRSAILLPLSDLGVVIVDEEHDLSYKEEQKPRYHTRDVALKRSEMEKSVVILGSATPSLEAMHAVKEGRLALIELEERVTESARPSVRVIDLKKEKSKGSLSFPLEKAIEERLSRREQTILFLNRRGFHRFSLCPHCGWVARCEKCGIALVNHKTTGLMCHYCTSIYQLPKACPDCGQKSFFQGGYGTERIVDEIRERFPWARVIRWDRDAAKGRGDHQRIYDAVRKGEFDVLVGTQMVAQGFHLPNVTLVGVMDADVSLLVPDFRAAEKTFQLLTQVAGRAGREMVTGEVFIQSRHTDHYAIRYALNMDFKGFAGEELGHRADLGYPPFSHVVTILIQKRDEEKRVAELLAWVNEFQTNSGNDATIGVLGPNKINRKLGWVRWGAKIMLKIPINDFDRFLSSFYSFLSGRVANYHVDID